MPWLLLLLWPGRLGRTVTVATEEHSVSSLWGSIGGPGAPVSSCPPAPMPQARPRPSASGPGCVSGVGVVPWAWPCGDPGCESCSQSGHGDAGGSVRRRCGCCPTDSTPLAPTREREGAVGAQGIGGPGHLSWGGVPWDRHTWGRTGGPVWLEPSVSGGCCRDRVGKVLEPQGAGSGLGVGGRPGRGAPSDSLFTPRPAGPPQRQDERHLLVPGEQQRHPPPAAAGAHLRGA